MTGLDLRAATHERLQSRALEQNCSIDDMINRVLDDTVSTSTLPYQDMLNSTSDIIALFDLDFRYVYVNVSIEAITGLAAPEMIGKTHRELNMPEEQILYWESIYHEVLTTRQEKVLRFNFPSVDGQGYYETRLTPVLNARGDIECVLGITRDITDRKRVEDDLRRSETNLRAMFNITWQSFTIIDRDYRIIDADEKGKKVAEAIFGKRMEPGVSIHDFVLARDRDSFAANFLSAVNGQRVTIEKMFESLPGQTSYYEVTYDPLVDHEGTIIGVCMSYQDITERKLSQLALSNSEADYRLLAQNVTDMISRHAPDGVYTFVTPSSEVLLGYTSEDLIGHQAYEFFHPDDVPVVRQSHDNILKQPLVSIIQYRIRRKDGEYIWFETSSRTIQDALTGESTEIVAVSRDISERKRIEEALSRSEARLRSLVETQTAFVVRTDLNGNYTYANPSFSNRYHWFSDNLLQYSVLDTVLPADHDKAIAAAELCLAKPGQPTQVTLRKTVAPNEDFLWTLWEFVAIQDADHVITEIQCIGFDISEQIRAEEAIRFQAQLLNTVGQAVIATNVENKVSYWNRFAETLYGWSSAEAIGRNIMDLTPADISQQQGEEIMTRLQSGEGWSGEFMVQRKDGTTFPALVTDNPIVDEQGVQIGIIGISMDITDRRQAEARLAKVNRTLALISSVNQSIVRIRLVSELFETVCRIAVEIGGFHMAWIGLFDSETRRVHPVAHSGLVEDYLGLLDIGLDDKLRGYGPTGTALRTGEPVIVNDIEHDPRMMPWREDALRLGYLASAAFPLNLDGEMRGVLNLYAKQADFFDAEELTQLDEMVADISFAMEFAEKEAQRQQALMALKQHVQAVEEMRLFLQTTLDAFPANTVVVAPDGTIINVNAAWIRFADDNSAPSAMHYIGANYLTTCDTSAEMGSEEAASAADGIRAIIDGSQDEFYLEYPTHSPSEKRWFALRVTSFPEPAPRRVVVAHINVTERKQAEENLQNLYNQLEKRVTQRTAELQASKERVEAILNSSADAILLLNRDFSIQQTNASFNSLFASEQDDYFDKSLNALLDANDSDSMDRLLQAAADQSRLVIDVQARRKDDTIFAAELSIGFIRDDSFVCAFHDITERKKIEQSLQMAVEKEKELNELKTRFVSMASHEFRTPLATIHAVTETLSAYRHKLTEDQIDLKLSNIRGQVGYLKDIMDDVLKLAQLQMRRVAFNPDTVDFDVLCREVIEEFQNRTDITHVILYTCEDDLPAAQLDKKLMRQLVSNLVSNAIKYSPHDKTITLNLGYTAKTLVFTVRDRGIGIPDDDLKHLFEPFHRGTNVGSIHGTGLGLVIAKESVELHGGTIIVESQMGTGTTFTVHIPIKAQGV